MCYIRSFSYHRNILNTLGVASNGTNSFIVMEYCKGPSLDTLLFDTPTPIPDIFKVELMLGIAEGMVHLHQYNIVHGDLAARNILMHENVPKVSDFGLSRIVEDIDEQYQSDTAVGPLRWMVSETYFCGHTKLPTIKQAPEALRGIYSSKTDVWSFGIVMFEIINQTEPHIFEDPLFVGLKIR